MSLMSHRSAIPLVVNKMINYKDKEGFEKEYFGEISLIMHEGIGIFNFGIGELASMKCGKSQLISDIIYPVSSQKSFMHVNDQNIMNIGTVDVLFEYMCDQKRNIVLMDGQGLQNISVLEKCIKLSNVLVVHVDYEQLKTRIT